jgi:hypothetical protein
VWESELNKEDTDSVASEEVELMGDGSQRVNKRRQAV